MYQYDIYLVIRLLIAALCGVLIGMERKNRAKEAGVRTHCLVACAAALMMVLSKYAYWDALSDTSRLDPSKVAASVVSGVGFLGAGMIFVHKRNITGLTTAAGIWATAGVGMAIGSGMYVVGIAMTLLILLVQIVLHSDNSWFRPSKLKRLTFSCPENPRTQSEITEMLQKKGITVSDVSMKKDSKNNLVEFSLLLEIPEDVPVSEIINEFEGDCTLTLDY
ncbi:MAG: MgtC/SapB family protein [Ruminococcaceae bacterium]|nr:MgtC/SapB family protein [Oscillospiraceae bacterium]